MNLTTKTITSAILCTSLIGFTAYADVTDKVVKSFNVEENAEFRIENINGEIDISGWSKNEIEVTATITADSQEDRDNIKINFTESGRGVAVETKYGSSSFFKKNNNNSGKVTYVVKVPSSGSLKDVELVNGSLSVEGVSGQIKADVVNGSVSIDGITANSEIASVNGSIKVKYGTAASKLEDINLSTVNGSIKLYVPADINANIDVETMHGSIKNDFGLEVEKSGFIGKSLNGDIGSGDIKVSIESVNGSVKVLKL